MDNDIRIYFDDRIVVLTTMCDEQCAMCDVQHSIANRKSQIANRAYVFENKRTLARLLNHFEESDDACLCITHHDLDELFGYVTECFKYVEAAGGLVTLPDGRILLIKRLGKWDLPKGKAKKGESLQETAIREVMEECGLETSPIITADLAHTFHTYYRNGAHVLKHTAWFTMRYDGEDDALYPQYEEDITEAIWMPRNQLGIVLQNTYESIRQVLDKWLMING